MQHFVCSFILPPLRAFEILDSTLAGICVPMSLILETLGKPIKIFPKDLIQELYCTFTHCVWHPKLHRGCQVPKLFKSEQYKYFPKYKQFCILPKYQFQHRNLIFPLQPAFHPEIVLVRLKILEWPARVLAKKGDKVEVVLFSKRKTTTEVMEDQTRPYAMANVSSKNSEMRRAYEEAQKLV
mgnify:CR=1 FL=1